MVSQPAAANDPFGQAISRQLIARHELNDRVQKTTRQEYAAGILSQGFYHGVRSECWAILDTQMIDGKQVNVARVLTAGTLIEGIYDAFATDPSNAMVKQCIHRGSNETHTK